MMTLRPQFVKIGRNDAVQSFKNNVPGGLDIFFRVDTLYLVSGDLSSCSVEAIS